MMTERHTHDAPHARDAGTEYTHPQVHQSDLKDAHNHAHE